MRLLCFCSGFLGATLAASSIGAQATGTPRPPVQRPNVKTAPPKEAAPKPAPPPAVPTTGFLQGVAIDSLHGEPLAGAIIQVEGTARLGVTDSIGRFLIDSIPPGTYRVLVDHPLIDTLGIALVTPPMTFSANEVMRTIIAVPTAELLTGFFCPPARRNLGPGALVGRVREPDSDVAAEGARVSFVWYDPDPPGLPAQLRIKKQPRVRETVVSADGTYRLCGLPESYEGKLQAQRKDGGATAEVTVSQSDGLLALRSMSVAPLPKVATGDSAAAPVLKGSARVVGKVLNANGAPVANARVGLMGGSAATLTRANGDFILDSLPAGTQALVVRQIGYRPTEVPVELSARTPARVTVRLGIFVPELTPVEVVSQRDAGLQKVGYLDRKRSSTGGTFIDPEAIERRHAMQFSDLLRTVPGLRVQSAGGPGNQNVVTSTRGTGGGTCVTIWVDGGQWQQLAAGDLDSFVRPEEVAAVEVYHPPSVPAQFTSSGGGSCAAVVVWTKTRVQSRRR